MVIKKVLKFQISYFQLKLTSNLLVMLFIRLIQTIKVEKQKLSKKMKLQDQLQRFMPKKALVMLDMQVEKHLSLSEEELLMVQKVSQTIKKEKLTKVRKKIVFPH